MLYDSKIKSISYKKEVEYKLWEKAYYLIDGKKKIKLSSKKEINKRLKEINNVYLIRNDKLGDAKYYLKISAWMESVKLYPPLSWIVDIVSERGFETPWFRKKIK